MAQPSKCTHGIDLDQDCLECDRESHDRQVERDAKHRNDLDDLEDQFDEEDDDLDDDIDFDPDQDLDDEDYTPPEEPKR